MVSTADFIPLGDVIKWDRKERNEESHADAPCFICGKALSTAEHWVRLDKACGGFIPADDPATEDGGWFEVGPECAKKLPRSFTAETPR